MATFLNGLPGAVEAGEIHWSGVPKLSLWRFGANLSQQKGLNGMASSCDRIRALIRKVQESFEIRSGQAQVTKLSLRYSIAEARGKN